MSGFAGLRDFTLEFTTIIDPDLKAETIIGKSFILDANKEERLNKIEGIANYSKIVEERIIVTFDDNKKGVSIKGVDANFVKINTIDSVLWDGSWLTAKTNQIVVGLGVSNALNIGVLNYGKRVSLYVPKPGKGQITSQEQAFNKVDAINVGVFAINDNINDSHLFSTLDLAQELLNYKENQITNIEFRLTENADENEVKTQIQAILGENITLKNTAQLNDALYKMLNTENLAVYLIFTLVLIIAFFNVVGSLIMMMLDKKKSLNTLFNVGATVKDIRRIFFLQGSLMSVFGGLIGLAVSALLVLFQLYGPDNIKIMITNDLAYPMSFQAENLVIVFITITVLGVIASKIASIRITKNMIKTS